MATEMNVEAERAAFITAYRLWAYEAHPNAHPEMVQFQAESHWGRAAGAMWLAARRAAQPADVGAGELPPLPPRVGMIDFVDEFARVTHKDGWTADQMRQYARDAIAADRRARRPRVDLDPHLKAALEEAAKTRSTGALLPDGSAVFINYGHQPEDTAHLECTACGGSGHIDDQRLIAGQSGEETPQAAQGVKTWRERMTDGAFRDPASPGLTHTGASAQLAARDAEIADLRAQLARQSQGVPVVAVDAALAACRRRLLEDDYCIEEANYNAGIEAAMEEILAGAAPPLSSEPQACRCVGCEGKPSAENNPCAVCGTVGEPQAEKGESA